MGQIDCQGPSFRIASESSTTFQRLCQSDKHPALLGIYRQDNRTQLAIPNSLILQYGCRDSLRMCTKRLHSRGAIILRLYRLGYTSELSVNRFTSLRTKDGC